MQVAETRQVDEQGKASVVLRRRVCGVCGESQISKEELTGSANIGDFFKYPNRSKKAKRMAAQEIVEQPTYGREVKPKHKPVELGWKGPACLE